MIAQHRDEIFGSVCSAVSLSVDTLMPVMWLTYIVNKYIFVINSWSAASKQLFNTRLLGQKVQPGEHGQKDTQTDGCYQEHYLPRFVVNKQVLFKVGKL